MTTSDEIKKYRALIESAMHSEAAPSTHEHDDLDNPAHVAQVLHHMFGAGTDAATLKDVLMGHKSDPQFALQTLNHLEDLIK
jgi:hypothetical protein